MDGLHRVTQFFGKLRDLVAGVGGIAAAVIEEVADVVRLEDFDQAIVFAFVGFQALEFVAAGTECAGGCVTQGGDGLGGFLGGVDQLFGSARR